MLGNIFHLWQGYTSANERATINRPSYPDSGTKGHVVCMHGSGIVTRSYKEFRLTHSPVKALLLGESIISRYKSMSIF